MSYVIGFVAGAIATCAAIWFAVRLLNAAETEEHLRKVERNQRTYGAFVPPAAGSAPNGREDGAEHKAA